MDNLSTSSANLDLVRSIYAAWERGDFTGADWAHPQIECVVIGGVLGDKVTGLAGFAEAWRGWLDAWKNFRAGAEEYRDLGESVLVLTYFSGVGKTSGPGVGEVQTRGASVFHIPVFHIPEVKVTRLVPYWDRDRALADLGLAPEADAAESPT